MFKALRRLFGVSEMPQVANRISNYLPESQVPQFGIDGVASDGSTWQEWRTDTSGEKWYRRTSAADSVQATPTKIHAIDSGTSDDPTDEEFNDIDEAEILDDFDEMDELAEQDRLTREMFQRHIDRARDRAENNPFDIQEYEPEEDQEYRPDDDE
jgi:hypothetical protein